MKAREHSIFFNWFVNITTTKRNWSLGSCSSYNNYNPLNNHTLTIGIACKNRGSFITLKQSFNNPINGSWTLFLISYWKTYPCDLLYICLIPCTISKSCSGFEGPHVWITALIIRQEVDICSFGVFISSDFDCFKSSFTVSLLHPLIQGLREVMNMARSGAISVEISTFLPFMRDIKYFHEDTTNCSISLSFSSIKWQIVVVRVWTYAMWSGTVAEGSTGFSNNCLIVCFMMEISRVEECVTINSIGFRQFVSM